jgi:hypothetical protein
MARPLTQGGIDYPDGGFSSGGSVFPMAGDLGELAARLGSVVTHNREGNVVFLETFESGIAPWNVTLSGTGAEVIISNGNYRSSGYSCKMTAGSDASRVAQIARRFPYPAISLYGLEASALIDSNLQYLIITLELRDGATAYQFQVTYDPGNQELLVTIPGGSSVAVATGANLDTGYGLFHTFKFAVDLANDAYMRLIVNEAEYDISAYSSYSFSQATNPHLWVTITAYGNTGTNTVVYVDDVIVTRNEPRR